MIGFDFRRNYSVAYDASGYAPDLFARAAVDTIRHHNQDSPLFLYLPNLAPHSGNQGNNNPAPPEEIAKFAYIKNEQRRAYAAKVSILDRGVGEIVKSLKEEGMLENSVILFFSDNGSPVEGELFNYGSNYPFRGVNNTNLLYNVQSTVIYYVCSSKRTLHGKVQFERPVEFGVLFWNTNSVYPSSLSTYPIGFQR